MARRADTPTKLNPEWTPADIASAKPGRDVFSKEFLANAATHRKGRGPQKAPTKKIVTIRLDADVIQAFKADGPGWQGRMNDALRAKAKPSRRPRTKTA
jgi:uncharacterized protein (DUF4415 family)